MTDDEAVPHHVAAHNQVLAHGEARVDVGLAVLVVSVVKVECQAHTDPADGHNVLLRPSVPHVLDVVGHHQSDIKSKAYSYLKAGPCLTPYRFSGISNVIQF